MKDLLEGRWPALIALAVGLAIVIGLAGTCSPDPTADPELARATRVAVESADRAHRQNDAARIWPGRLRLLTVAMGVGMPIAAAVVALYLVGRRTSDEVEILERLEHFGLLDTGRPRARLPASPKAARLPLAEAESLTADTES